LLPQLQGKEVLVSNFIAKAAMMTIQVQVRRTMPGQRSPEGEHFAAFSVWANVSGR